MTYGQKSEEPNFDIADFNKKMEVAEWLYEYDMIAWKTSDSIMTQDKKDLQDWEMIGFVSRKMTLGTLFTENMKTINLTLFFTLRLTMDK